MICLAIIVGDEKHDSIVGWQDMLSNDMKDELIRSLTEIFKENIKMIILYGSVARNEAKDDSDIDIAIIMKNDMDEKTQEQFIRWSADMDIRFDKVFSIIDIQEEKLEQWGNVLSFYKNVQKEGIVLWKAA